MFKKTLSDKLIKVFGLPKVSYDSPGEAKEQEVIFVTVNKAHSIVNYGKVKMRVEGFTSVFAQSDKLPFGFFLKKIQAMPEDCLDIFFYNVDKNEKYYGNLVERQCSFIYMYEGDYDPDAGEMTSVNLTTTVES